VITAFDQAHGMKLAFVDARRKLAVGRFGPSRTERRRSRHSAFARTSQKRKLHKEDKLLTEIKEVDPSAFTYMLVNAVHELSKQNDEMRRMLCADIRTTHSARQPGPPWSRRRKTPQVRSGSRSER
jgi:hypothetical protein